MYYICFVIFQSHKSIADNYEDILELSEIEIQPLPKITNTGRKKQKCLFCPLLSREYSEHIEHSHKDTKESEELAEITASDLPKARTRAEKFELLLRLKGSQQNSELSDSKTSAPEKWIPLSYINYKILGQGNTYPYKLFWLCALSG